MYLRYTPEGSDTQEWPISLGKFRTMEVEAIERMTGLDYGTEFKQKLMKGNGAARRALLWTVLRRAHPTLKYVDVDFADDEVVLQMDTDELTELRDAVATAPMSEDERTLALDAIARDIEAAPAPPGKALSQSA